MIFFGLMVLRPARAEAAQYLRLYIDQRRKGSAKIPPETLTDESPLIRDETRNTPKSIGSKQVRKIVHQLYVKADLLKKPTGRMYDLRIHSLRKYFKTQLLALGVQSDYVDYMMGHTVDTYHDIQSLGIDRLRNAYAASRISDKTENTSEQNRSLEGNDSGLGNESRTGAY